MNHGLEKHLTQDGNSCKDKQNSSNNSSNMSSVWLIDPLFFQAMSYLQCIDLSSLKAVNKMFQYKLDHKFVCDKFQTYFQYNKNEMKKIIQDQLCDDLSSLLKFYYSFLNISCQQTLFELEHDRKVISNEFKQDNDYNSDMTEFNTYTSCDFLFGIKYNGKNKNALVKFDSKHMKVYQYILNFVDGNYYTCNIERLIYDIIGNDLNTDALMLSSIYKYIKPLNVFCIELVTHNRRFRMNVAKRIPCFKKDNIKFILGKNKKIQFGTLSNTCKQSINNQYTINCTTKFDSYFHEFKTGQIIVINNGTLMWIELFSKDYIKINFDCMRCAAKVGVKKNKTALRRRVNKCVKRFAIWDWPDDMKKNGQQVTLIVCNGCFGTMLLLSKDNQQDENFEYLRQNSFETVYELLTRKQGAKKKTKNKTKNKTKKIL